MSECLWNIARDKDWNTMEDLWFDVIPCIEEMQGMIILGAPPQQAYAKAVKKDKKLHCKIVKLIMILKGEEITQEKEICLDDYKVTVSDINLLLKEYEKRKNEMSVIAEDITIW